MPTSETNENIFTGKPHPHNFLYKTKLFLQARSFFTFGLLLTFDSHELLFNKRAHYSIFLAPFHYKQNRRHAPPPHICKYIEKSDSIPVNCVLHFLLIYERKLNNQFVIYLKKKKCEWFNNNILFICGTVCVVYVCVHNNNRKIFCGGLAGGK